MAPDLSRLAHNVKIPYQRAPLCGKEQGAEHPDGRRLARAVGAEEAEQFPPWNAQRDGIHSRKVSADRSPVNAVLLSDGKPPGEPFKGDGLLWLRGHYKDSSAAAL